MKYYRPKKLSYSTSIHLTIQSILSLTPYVYISNSISMSLYHHLTPMEHFKMNLHPRFIFLVIFMRDKTRFLAEDSLVDLLRELWVIRNGKLNKCLVKKPIIPSSIRRSLRRGDFRLKCSWKEDFFLLHLLPFMMTRIFSLNFYALKIL